MDGTNDRGRINCPKGMDPDYSKKRCRNCGRQLMMVRPSRNRRGHWQHVGDGLVQYRSWRNKR